MTTVDNDLARNLSAALDALNMAETMTSQAEVELQQAMTSLSELSDELTSLESNVTRVSDVSHDTRSDAQKFLVSTQHIRYIQ